ncbi:MAG: RteC domain-containing protein [Tannerella sp.]|nr:RteC domain-containing protein [Tannerella sp.]
MKWTGNVIEWVELIYALYSVKRINNGKYIKEQFSQPVGFSKSWIHHPYIIQFRLFCPDRFPHFFNTVYL